MIGGIVADLLGIPAAITVAGGLAIFSGVAAFAMLAAQVEPHEDVAVA